MKRSIRLLSLLLAILITLPAVAQPQMTHPWTGKKVAYLGDSITDPKNKAAKKKYWNYLEEWLGITPFVYAVSGRQWNDIPHQTDQLKQEHGDDVDAVIVFIGTNDYNKGIPLGRWYDETLEKVDVAVGEPRHADHRLRRVPAMDPTTYRGRINIALDSLKRTYPTKQIVLLTPIHRSGFYRSETNWQPSEDYTNLSGSYLDDYVDVVREAGRVWAVPVIDLGQLSGLYPLYDEYARFFNDPETDRLHPNDLGHERLAQTLYYQLAALPVF